MKKKFNFTFLRITISFFFLYIVLSKSQIKFKEVFDILKDVHLPTLILAYILLFLINIPLALRFKYILEIYFEKNLSSFFILKLTMIGLFFNNFLPTSAGGDIVKIFYIVRDEKKKFLSGISVLIDRYIGALTVMTMGTISIFFYKGIERKIYYSIIIFFILLIFSFYFFSKREFATIFYSPVKKFIPPFLNEKLLNFYNSIHFYFTQNRKNLRIAIFISFLLQILSIFSQYLLSISIIKHNLQILPFFIFIPLIWTSTLIPSLGGLGIREFTYISLFSDFIGKENAYVLSLLVLTNIILNSLIGGIIFLISGIKQSKLT
ncbi:MAG: flippase-like domain-containing protein [bacterium]|nr:flippase-like domain-containing protein [bacterium]